MTFHEKSIYCTAVVAFRDPAIYKKLPSYILLDSIGQSSFGKSVSSTKLSRYGILVPGTF
ncbi:hypothetical protein GCM10011325_19970 [Dyadobacter sediminis]|nr:hypothetical protein GCM10011325_19970 [Dyadobacter sediminis]